MLINEPVYSSFHISIYYIANCYLYCLDYKMPGTWPKQKVKETRIDLGKFNRCLSTTHLRNSLSFSSYHRQNITMEYF